MSTNIHQAIGQRILRSGNCLAVLAGGLCETLTVNAVISELLTSRPTAISPLTIVLGEDEKLFSQFSPKNITGETSMDSRQSIYAAGGVVVVTERVLLSDLLTQRLDGALIDLLILPHAHGISDTSNEAFIVRLFRERNPKGFLVAISEKPHIVSSSMDQLVKSLFLSEVLLFPRFHEAVHEALSKASDMNIQQHDCPLSVRQIEMQSLVCGIITSCIEEIKKSKPQVPLLEVDAHTLIRNKTELFALRRKLEPVWMKLSWTTRQIVSDLSIIRQILAGLSRYDPVHVWALITAQQQVSLKASPWWLSEDARRLVQLAKLRVGLSGSLMKASDFGSIDDQSFVMETSAKWNVIQEIVNSVLADQSETEQDPKRIRRTFREMKILVITGDEIVARELEGFINEGPERASLESLRRYMDSQNDAAAVSLIQQAIDSLSSKSLSSANREGRCEVMVSCSLEKGDELVGDLGSIRPDLVVLMEPSLVAVRAIEVFCHTNPQALQVHILSHSQSLVEPDFSTLVGRENEAFDSIIRGKNTLSFFSKNELFEQTKRAKSAISAPSSRKGGSRRARTVADLLRQRVLVDTRELRSALPLMLYRKGYDISPTTLGVGDYILSRDIAVERKSVTGNDLQQSLSSGRLYKQLVNMTHAFAWPVLLLEFSTGKAFQLQSTDSTTGEISPSSLIARIVSLIMHFPSLRLIWSPSFAFTASIFGRMKIGREQPRIDPVTREPVSAIDPTAMATSQISKRAVEFLKACPGITAANLPSVLKRVKSIRELVELDSTELISVMGKRDGNLFLKFINHQH